ncbi:uncharacterized protein LOC144681505 [Cetorhinus maximus]
MGMENESPSRLDQLLENRMKKDSFSASLQSLYDELGLALGEGRNAASSSPLNVEINRRLKVTEMVTVRLPTSESSTNCPSLDKNFSLLPEERKTQEEMDQFNLQKLKRNILPSIRKGEEIAFGNKKAPQEKLPFSDRTKPLKPPPSQRALCVKKSKCNTSRDIAPWVGNSLLGISFSAIPQSLGPFPCHTSAQHHLPCGAIGNQRGLAEDPTEENSFSRNQDGYRGTGSKVAQPSRRALPEGPTGAKALLTQRSGKDGWSPRRLRNNWQEGAPRPPVQSISNLSFSRNFTFSFFDLPQHLSQQYRTQRTLTQKQVHS